MSLSPNQNSYNPSLLVKSGKIEYSQNFENDENADYTDYASDYESSGKKSRSKNACVGVCCILVVGVAAAGGWYFTAGPGKEMVNKDSAKNGNDGNDVDTNSSFSSKAKNFLGVTNSTAEDDSSNTSYSGAVVAAANAKSEQIQESTGMSCGAITAIIGSSVAVIAGAVLTIWCCCCKDPEMEAILLMKNGDEDDMNMSYIKETTKAEEVADQAQQALDLCVAIAKNS